MDSEFHHQPFIENHILTLYSDHVNDYCSLSLDSQQKPALWMCYAGGVGFGGYAGYGGYHRRIRVFEVDTNEARITTWKRVEWGDTSKRIDEQIIVEAGGPIGIREKKA